MKKLMALIALAVAFVSTSAMAEYCSYELQGRSGGVFERFTEYGYDRIDACQNAQRECERSQYRRRRSGQRPGMCVRLGSVGPRPPRGRFNCTADLHRGNGSVMRTFRSSGVNRGQACKTARQQCEREASRMRRRGRTAVYCTTEPRGGNGGGTIISRSCSAELVSPRFGIQQVFQGYASGRSGTGVQQRACDNAMDQCQMSRVRRQYCRKR